MHPSAPTFSRHTNGAPKLFLVQTSSAIHLPEPSQSAFTLPRQGRRNAVLAAVGLPLFVAAHLILEFVFHL